MLEHDIIENNNSPWSTHCLLVPKPEGSFRFCTDFRKVNAITKTESYPIPRIEDCIDRIGGARYVSKFDLLKGYWQVLLTERAKEYFKRFLPIQGDAFWVKKCTCNLSKNDQSFIELLRCL